MTPDEPRGNRPPESAHAPESAPPPETAPPRTRRAAWRPDPAVIREMRAELPLLCCLAVLVAVLTVLAAAGPGLVDRLAAQALVDRLAQVQRAEPGVVHSAHFDPSAPGKEGDLAQDLERSTGAIESAAGGALGGALVHDSTRVDVPLVETATGGGVAGLGLVYASDAPGRDGYVQGRPPDPHSEAVEIAVSTRTRDALKVHVGQRLALTPGALKGIHTTAEVVGVFTTGQGESGIESSGRDSGGGSGVEGGGDSGRDSGVEGGRDSAGDSGRDSGGDSGVEGGRDSAGDSVGDSAGDSGVEGGRHGDAGRLWREKPLLVRPLANGEHSPSGLTWEARALVTPRTVTTLQSLAQTSLTVTWGMRLDLDADTARRFVTDSGQRDFQRLLARYPDTAEHLYCGYGDFGGLSCEIGGHPATALETSTRLPEAMTVFARQWRQGRAVVSFALASLIVVGLAAAVVTALLAVRRRRDAHRLQRARGASATWLALVRAGETAPAVLLGLGVGLGVAYGLTGGSTAYGQGLLVAVLGWLLLPALTWFALRERSWTAAHERASRPGGRRMVAEASVLLLAAGGVFALRSRGTAGTAGPDPLLAAVPALLGLATVAVLVRCYPLPVRLLARWSARRRGGVALIALSRAAQEATARALALLVLVVTLAGAVFGGLVSATLAEGRQDALAWQVGADASFTGADRDPQVAERLAHARGVRHSVMVRRRGVDPTSGTDGGRYGAASLVGVDGSALRAAAPDSVAARALDDAGLTGPRHGKEIRVLASGSDPGELLTITAHGRSLRLRVAGPLPDGVLRDRALGPLLSASEPGGSEPRPRLLLADNRNLTVFERGDFEESALLLYGTHLKPGALRGVVPRSGSGTALGELRILAEERAEAADDGMVRAISTAHTACTALAVLLALLALVLELLLSAPARARTTACLRTLGLGGRAASGLHLLQLLPMVVAAMVGGTALGLLLPGLLGPALDLGEFTGGPGDPARRTDILLTAVLGAGLGVLVCAAVGLETWIGRRRGLGAVLRLGEPR